MTKLLGTLVTLAAIGLFLSCVQCALAQGEHQPAPQQTKGPDETDQQKAFRKSHQLGFGKIKLSPYIGGTFDFPGAGVGGSEILQLPPPTVPPTPPTVLAVQAFNIGRRLMPLWGGEAAFCLAAPKYVGIWLYGDYAYAPPDREKTTATHGASSVSTSADRHYRMLIGGVEFTPPDVRKFSPYLHLGGGQVREGYNFFTSGSNVVFPNGTNVVQGTREARGISAFNIGGGVDLYLKSKKNREVATWWFGLRFGVDYYILRHGLEQAAPSAGDSGLPSFVTRKSGGRVTIGFIIHHQ